MRKEQVLLLALLGAALFRPASSQDHPDDDYCHVKTSIVLKKLDICDSEKIKDDFRRNQLWTDVVKETIDEMMKQLREDIKSKSDQATEKLENKMEDLMMKVQSIKDCQRILATWPLIDRMNTTLFFKAMGRTFYYDFTHDGTWYENRDWCSSRGMQLATLKTAEELKQVVNTLEAKTPPRIRGYGFWVSVSDIGRSPGQFQWADGTPVLNSTWVSGRPSKYKANQETCAYIYTGYEKLLDWPCSDTWRTLCEVPELLATCL